MVRFDVVVLGAGAAGLLCAIEAGRRGRRVLMIDHADRVGKKILISGGGRSNFTNMHCEPGNFLSANPHFAKSALARFTPADMIALVEKHRIPYHEKTLGQLFCDRSSRDLVAALERECAEAGVATWLETTVAGVAESFVLTTSRGEVRCESLVVATGGLSIPKMGATGFGYELARQFGLRIVEPRPGLVPFTFGPEDRERWCDLSGVSAEAVATTWRQQFREKALVTHKGLSGPVALQISSYWAAGAAGFAGPCAGDGGVRAAAGSACPARRPGSVCAGENGVAGALGGTLDAGLLPCRRGPRPDERANHGARRGRCTRGGCCRPEPRATRRRK